MAGTARVMILQGQSCMNGNGYYTDVTSNIPNQSVGYRAQHLRYPFLRPIANGVVVVQYEVRHQQNYVWEAQAAGTCGNTALPSSPTIGNTYSDGGVNWKCLRAALADVPSYPGDVGVEIGCVFKTSANAYYQVVAFVNSPYTSGTLGATEPSSSSAAGVTSGGCRLKYLGVSTEARKLNQMYTGRVKIWNNWATNPKFQNFGLPTTGTTQPNGNGLDDDAVRILIGPQIPVAAQMLSLWDDDNNFIIKHAVDGITLAYVAALNNYSIQSYDAGTLAFLKNLCDHTYNAVAALLGTAVTDWASGAAITAGVTRKNAGNVYSLLQAGGGNASNAPVHTSGTVTGADGYVWRFLHTVYDTVQFAGIIHEHGAQDTTEASYAYPFRFNLLNEWRRINQRFQFADTGGLFVSFVEPFTPRGDNTSTGSLYKTAFAQEVVKPGIRAALKDYAERETGGSVTPVDSTYHITYSNRAAWIKTWDMFSNATYYNRANNELHYTCAGHEEFIARWRLAYDSITTPATPPIRTWGGSQTTSFYGGGSRPTLTESSSSVIVTATEYAPGATVSVTLTASINGGSTSGIEWFWGDDAATVIGAGLTLSIVPTHYNGRVLRARVRDPNGYWAYFSKFIYVRAPRNALTDYCTANGVTIRQWIRGALGAVNVTAAGRFDRLPNRSGDGATSNINAIQTTGLAYSNTHHDGIAMTSAVALRLNTGTTDGSATQQTAALDTASNDSFTRFFKGKVYWHSNAINNLAGSALYGASSGVNGGYIALEASANANGDDTALNISARHATNSASTLVTSSGDVYDGGEQIIVAEIKNGSARTLRWRLPNGTFAQTTVTGTATNALGYPDVIGWQAITVVGFEGVMQEVIGLNQHAITDGTTLDAIMNQLAANDAGAVVVTGTGALTLEQTTASGSGSATSPVASGTGALSLASPLTMSGSGKVSTVFSIRPSITGNQISRYPAGNGGVLASGAMSLSQAILAASGTVSGGGSNGFPTYRAPNGSDAYVYFGAGTDGDGSIGSPWNNLTASRLQSIAPGQQLVVRGVGAFPDTTVQVQNGTSLNRVVVRCHPDYAGSGFTFSGVGSRTGGGSFWDFADLVLQCANGNGLVFGESDAFTGGLAATDWRVVRCVGTKAAEPGSINAGSGIIFATSISAIRGQVLGGSYTGVGGTGNQANIWLDYARAMTIAGILTKDTANPIYFKHANAADAGNPGGTVKNCIIRNAGRGFQAALNYVDYLNNCFDATNLSIDEGGGGAPGGRYCNILFNTFLNAYLTMNVVDSNTRNNNIVKNNVLLGSSHIEDNRYNGLSGVDQNNVCSYNAVAGTGTIRYWRNSTSYNTPFAYHSAFAAQEPNATSSPGLAGTINLAGGSTPGDTAANWAFQAGSINIGAADNGANCGADYTKLLTGN